MTRPDSLVGRSDALARSVRAVTTARRGQRASLLVTGGAGTGKTALLRAVLSRAEDVDVAWGTCRDGGAPGYWPWTQALSGLVRTVGLERALRAAGQDAGLLATVVPGLGPPSSADGSERERLLLLDAVVSWLRALAAERPLVVVLDDLQWADESSLELLRVLVEDPRRAALAVLAAVRADELVGARRVTVGALIAAADHLALTGLDRVSADRLVRLVAGSEVDAEQVAQIWERARGHPFFTRELALSLSAGTAGTAPAAVQEAVLRRMAQLSPGAQELLPAAAVQSGSLGMQVLAAVVDRPAGEVAAVLAEAGRAGVLVAEGAGWRFAHDLFRETLAATHAAQDLPPLHLRTAEALEMAHGDGYDVSAAELARHFRAALPVGPVTEAARWALRAAEADRGSAALAEAAQHLRLLRAAVAGAAVDLPVALQVQLLLVEADLLVRAGRPSDARGLLRAARAAAEAAQAPELVARTALAVVAVGSRFAARRDDVVQELESALEAVEGRDAALEASLMGALARELHHSVPEQRGRAVPLSERALELGRGSDDPEVLRACLLARHDVLWTPGTAPTRAEVAAELVGLAERAGDRERLAEALLLQANALLEGASAAYLPVLERCLGLLEELAQPRHEYTVRTRRACLALMRGRLEEAEALIEQAAELGERLREPDTGNVRMSQRLELVRARSAPDELLAFAAGAVEHWVGTPVHAHAVAAGFCARAGAADQAAHHVAVVRRLGGWQADRSYLWSVLVRELAAAAIALEDEALCAQLLEELRPLAGTCGVNGAVVAFAGAHAETAGRLAAALGQGAAAEELLADALRTCTELGVASLHDPGAAPASARLHRRGPVWDVAFDGRSALVGDCKGLEDIARLIARDGRDVHVLELATPRVSASVQPATERARKAVTARIRDAVRRIEQEHPELAAHLDAALVTGVRCRYVGERGWDVRL